MAENEIEVTISFEPNSPVYTARFPGTTSVDDAVANAYEALAQDQGKVEVAKRLDTILRAAEGYELRKVLMEEGKPSTETVDPDELLSDIAKEGRVEISPIGTEEAGYLFR
jgi:hypothetical protein